MAIAEKLNATAADNVRKGRVMGRSESAGRFWEATRHRAVKTRYRVKGQNNMMRGTPATTTSTESGSPSRQ